MTPRTHTLAVLSAGLSRPSSTRLLADRLAIAVTDTLTADGDRVEVSVIELRDLGQDVVNAMLTGFPSPALAAAIEQVTSAEALIAVTPIFSASYSGLFKSFFDVLDPQALVGKPVLIAATGGSQRHSLALEHAVRPLFSYLRTITMPTAVYAASSDWGSGPDGDGAADDSSALSERIDRAGAELGAQLARSGPVTVTDPFANPTSFAELLRRGSRVS